MYSGPDMWAFCLDMLFITKELQKWFYFKFYKWLITSVCLFFSDISPFVWVIDFSEEWYNGLFVAINIEFERSRFKMSLFSFSEHPTFVACLGPQQTLKYVTVSLIFILNVSKVWICPKVYASILSLIF